MIKQYINILKNGTSFYSIACTANKTPKYFRIKLNTVDTLQYNVLNKRHPE